MRSFAFVAATLLASVASAQIAIPPWSGNYTGFTRGFCFTSQNTTPFYIVGLDLPLDNYAPGDLASYLVTVNGVTAYYTTGNTGSVGTCIPVNLNDQVFIYGNWTTGTGGNFTAKNSYSASVTGFATTIEGVANTLYRTGWQWDISAPGFVTTGAFGTSLGLTTTGQLGRIIVTTSSVGCSGVLASNTTLGEGCVKQFGSFYEGFAASSSFDLANTALTMFPSGAGYVVTNTGSFLPVGSTSTPVNLALTDDSEVVVPFTVGSFPGWTGVAVGSNGYVSKAAGNPITLSSTPATHLNNAQEWFVLGCHDFNPAAAGSGLVKMEETAAVTVITWDGVYDFGGTSASTMQLQLYANGSVTMAWGTMSAAGNGFFTGYSPSGPNLDPGTTDISAVLGTGTITLAVPEIAPLTLTATNRPVQLATGPNTWNLVVSNIPATTTIGIDIFGLSDPAIPDLSPFGLAQPGCQWRASLDALSVWVSTGTTHNYSFTIPATPSANNFHLFTQSVGLAAPFSLNLTSNGIDGKVGNL